MTRKKHGNSYLSKADQMKLQNEQRDDVKKRVTKYWVLKTMRQSIY